MANEASKTNDPFFTEPIKQKEEMDRLPSLIKALKLKFGNDGKQIHRVAIKFLDNGKEILIPDNFNQNNGKEITKRVFELEWEGNKHAFFVSKALGSDSLYSQIKSLGLRNKSSLIGVKCVLTITGKIGEKTMRYIIEDSPAPNGVSETIKDYSGEEFEVLRLMKSLCSKNDNLTTTIELNKQLNYSTEKLNVLMMNLYDKGDIFAQNAGGFNKWGVKK